MKASSSAIFLALMLVCCAGADNAPLSASASRDDLRSDGRDIAESQCAGCHSVSSYGGSPNPEAPPLRTVLSRYDETSLEYNLIEGIRVAHPMPDFSFNPVGADALIAYLRSIQEPEPAAERSKGSQR